MYDSLLKHITQLPADAVGRVFLEDITLSAVWYESYREMPERRAPYDGLRQVLDRWVSEAAPVAVETEGHRQQPLLRALIAEVVKGHADALTRDELDFLCFAWGLAQRAERTDLFQRSVDCLEPHIPQLEKRRELLPPAPGLPALAERFMIFTPDDLKLAPVRDVKLFAGIDLPIRGPVFSHRGGVKILGNIPEDCAVVVEEGSCYVQGRVLGKLAATYSCEVFDNISGAVIARRGCVRARHLVNQATVISKDGAVACTAAEEPRMVFAGSDLDVRHSAVNGVYIGRRVQVAECLHGGEVHVSQQACADLFKCSSNRPLSVVLRRGFTCQDYGEVLTAEAARLLVTSMKLKQRLLNLYSLLAMTEREADDYAGNVLFFLLGEDNTTEQVEKLQRLRRREAFLDRLIAGSRAILGAIEDRVAMGLEQYASDSESHPTPFGEDEKRALDDLQKELMLLVAEGPVDRDLFEARDDLLLEGRRLNRKMLTRRDILDLLKTFLNAVNDLTEKRDAMVRQIDHQEAALKNALSRRAIIDRAKAACARVEVLGQIVAQGRKRAGNDVFKERINNRYVKLMQRNIESRLSRRAGYKTTVLELEARVNKIRDKLWTEYMVSLPEGFSDESGAAGARVSGKFEAGTVITAWKHLLENPLASHPGIVITPALTDHAVTFERTARGAIERR